MSTLMEEEVMPWTAKRKSALVIDHYSRELHGAGEELRPPLGAHHAALPGTERRRRMVQISVNCSLCSDVKPEICP